MKVKFLITVLFISASLFIQNPVRSQEDFNSVTPDVKYQFIGNYTIAGLDSILTTQAANFSGFDVTYTPAQNPVKLYRVLYNSVIPEFNDRPTVASGLIAVPDNGKEKMPVVSYQHGTVFTKTDVPSFPEESMETRLMIAQFAGQGYIVIAADYFGKGLSEEPDSYEVKESTQQACIDMLKASDEILKSLNVTPGPLFLSGWSMGAWSTLLFLEKLEGLGIPVTAAATACTPTDIFALVNRWIYAPEESDAVWLPGILALQLSSYEIYYQMPGLMESVVKPEYQQATSDFYRNKITFEEFYTRTASRLSEYLKPEFISKGLTGGSRLVQIAQDNNSYRWRSHTPLNLYYGDADEAVPEYIATLPADYQQLMGGGKTTSVPAGKTADHRGTFKFAVKDQKSWFDGMLK